MKTNSVFISCLDTLTLECSIQKLPRMVTPWYYSPFTVQHVTRRAHARPRLRDRLTIAPDTCVSSAGQRMPSRFGESQVCHTSRKFQLQYMLQRMASFISRWSDTPSSARTHGHAVLNSQPCSRRGWFYIYTVVLKSLHTPCRIGQILKLSTKWDGS